MKALEQWREEGSGKEKLGHRCRLSVCRLLCYCWVVLLFLLLEEQSLGQSQLEPARARKRIPAVQYNASLFVSSVHLLYWTKSIPNCRKPYNDDL